MLALEDVRAAARLLDGVAHRTPVMTSRTLDERAGGSVHLKCESFQRGGAFKFRGAFNFLSSLSAEERARGVCAISSGNHAQAVALSARELGVRAAILMPEDAPAAKLAAVEGYGAEITTYDRYSKPQVQAGREFAEERQMTFVPAYDDPRIAAGAGTATLELLEDAGALDLLLAPIGGGGLMSGAATVIKALHPGARVIGVEARGVGGHQALAGGRRADPDPRPAPHRRRADAHPAGRVDVRGDAASWSTRSCSSPTTRSSRRWRSCSTASSSSPSRAARSPPPRCWPATSTPRARGSACSCQAATSGSRASSTSCGARQGISTGTPGRSRTGSPKCSIISPAPSSSR